MAGTAGSGSQRAPRPPQPVVITIEAGRDETVMAARAAARRMAQQLGFSLVDQVRIVTAVSEIARNILMYGGRGTVRISACHQGERVGLEVVAEDRGPGIADVERVLEGGYSTSGGYGRGISGARALMSEFHLESQPGRGTRVVMRKWLE